MTRVGCTFFHQTLSGVLFGFSFLSGLCLALPFDTYDDADAAAAADDLIMVMMTMV